MEKSGPGSERGATLKWMIDDLDEMQSRNVLRTLIEQKQNEPEWIASCEAVLEKELRLSDRGSAERLHIALDASTAGSLKIAFRSEIEHGRQQVMAWTDHLSYGPLTGLEHREGWINRLSWLGQMHGYDDPEGMRYLDRGYRELAELPSLLSGETEVVIWAAGNSAEQTALRFVLWRLREFAGRVIVIDASSLLAGLAGRSDGVYMKSGELPTEKLRLAWEQTASSQSSGSLLTVGQRKRKESDWEQLSLGKGTLRRYTNSSIEQVPEDHYDAFLLETAERCCGPRRQYRQAARVIGEAVGNSAEALDDNFLNHRLSCLVYTGRLEFKGLPRQMRMYEVRPAAGPCQ